MGSDWEEFRESAGIGADEDSYINCVNDLRDRPSNKERWMSRNPNERLGDDEVEARVKAIELVGVKIKIQELERQEAQLKNELCKLIPKRGWLYVYLDDKADTYCLVEHLDVRRKPQLATKKALRFISQKFGVDAALLVLENCSHKIKKTTAIFVRTGKKGK